MKDWQGQRMLVVGAGLSGRAATAALCRRGACVVVADAADTPELQQARIELEALGAEVRLGVTKPLTERFDGVIISPGVPADCDLLRLVLAAGAPLLGELELGWQLAGGRVVAITGTNGKTTVTTLTARLLSAAGLRTIAAGNIGLPVCAVAESAQELDWLTLEVSSFQLETIRTFHPAIAVLMNITPDHLDRYASMAEYVRAKGRLFLNQQNGDWAVIQLEAWEQCRSAGVVIPSRRITFSANRPEADVVLKESRILCRKEPWAGEWFNVDDCRLRGPHNAENLMAALAVARILSLPPTTARETLSAYQPDPHRCELVAEIKGVKYVNDSKATNVDAVAKAILTFPPPPSGRPNIWLIAGGKDKGLEFDSLGPLLARRVRGAFLIGDTRHKIKAAWEPFIPCFLAESLSQAVHLASGRAELDDVVLLSPACSSFDQFRNYQHRGEVFRETVVFLQNTTNCGCQMSQTQHNGGITLLEPKKFKGDF